MQNISNLTELEIKQKRSKIIRLIFIYTLLVIFSIVVLFPFYYMLITAFKSFGEFTGELMPTLFPKRVTLASFKVALESVNLIKAMFNTFIFASITTLIMIVVVTLAAFAFARLDFPGKDFMFTVYLSTMMVPMEFFTITNYQTIFNLNLKNTYAALIFPSVLSVFYVYLLRQNFKQVPDELYYASKVDGTSDMKYLLKVLVPLSKPTIIFMAVLKFIECWNSYAWPRLVIDEHSDKNVISTLIEIIRTNGFGRENVPAMMAAVVLVSIPLIILFMVFRNQIMTGVSRNGSKG